ncbi:MAG: hypothetical protein A2017_21700 [Lentisphaerae bacterium GWF2_44_16]|nr:MAG: hypothetical protein A2017_21700 [Lentisphaerae bacterium GWF2_44_16]
MESRKFFALFISALCSVTAFAANQLIMVSDGKSDYQIVIPDKGKIPWMDGFLEKSAKLMQSSIAEAGNAVLPIAEESKRAPGKPCIYIGSTEKTKKTGINTDKMREWEYVLKTDGKDIFIFGKDIAGAKAKKDASGGYTQYELGTLKAVTAFLENYAGTRFIMPGPNGISVEKKAVIEVPEKLKLNEKPFFRYCIGRASNDIFYDIANNFYPTVQYGSYGGHSHPVAIAQDKYFKTHPEYFALIKGKRYTHDRRPQYCLSNPEVQELIYKELLRKLDEGYNYAQLAQSDGFRACECEECKKFYGVDDFGEKLWIMHKKMAERLLKDRPGKKAMIISYGPTSNPPATFKDFPENVSIELCNYSPENIEKWRNCTVPGGFTVYIYNWGFYKTEGFTPKRTPEFCKEQIELFRKNNIWGIYRCGFGELYGLEGPVYYTYGKLLENSGRKPSDLSSEYCESAFRDSAPSMKAFFNLLHERLKIELENADKTDWNDNRLLDGKIPDMHENVKVLLLRYPSDVVNKLELCLREAEKTAKDKKEISRLKLVRTEFDYLKKTALIAELFDNYRKSPSKELFEKLANAIEARNKFISDLPKTGKEENIAPRDGFNLFCYSPAQTLMTGGRLRCELKTPYNWDVALYKKLNFTPGSQEMKVPKTDTPVKIDGMADDSIWGKANPEHLLHIFMDKDIEVPETSVKASYDDKALYVLFRAAKASPEKYKMENITNWFYVFLENDKSMENLYMFPARSTNKNANIYKRFQTGNKEAPNEFKQFSEIKEKIDFACVTDEKTGSLTAEFRIPFSIYGKLPLSGDIWYGNFLRRIGDNKNQTDFIWEPNINWKTWRNRYDVMGKLIFQ